MKFNSSIYPPISVSQPDILHIIYIGCPKRYFTILMCCNSVCNSHRGTNHGLYDSPTQKVVYVTRVKELICLFQVTRTIKQKSGICTRKSSVHGVLYSNQIRHSGAEEFQNTIRETPTIFFAEQTILRKRHP